MRGSTVAICVVASMTAACAMQSGIVGSYIVEDSNYGSMVQITSIERNAVKGAITLIESGKDGTVNAVTRPLAGTLENRTLNLTVENGRGVSTATGIVTNQGIELTLFGNGDSQRLIFARRNADYFAGIVANVRKRSADVRQERAVAQREVQDGRQTASNQNRVNAVAADITQRAGAVADSTQKIDVIIGGYGEASRRAQQLRRASAMTASQFGASDYRIEQVSFERERNSDLAQTAHEQVADALARLNQASRDHEGEVASAQTLCVANPRLDCSGLSSAIALYRARASAFRAAAGREDRAYQGARQNL